MVRINDLRRTGRIIKTVQGPERLFIDARGRRFIVVGNTVKILGKRTKRGFNVRG